jgi:hypothetical protein
MTVLPLALSLSSSLTQVGAIAAFAALLGVAILALLVFSQARELKRLREWAGRAPERAAEMEQRVSADAAARVQQVAPPIPAVRQVPRTVPVVARPAAGTTGVGPATAVVPGVPGEAAPAVAEQAAAASAAGPGESTPLPGAGVIAPATPAASAGTPSPNAAGTPAPGAPGTGSSPAAGAGTQSTQAVPQSADGLSREGWDAVRATTPPAQPSPSGAPQTAAGVQSESGTVPPTAVPPATAPSATAPSTAVPPTSGAPATAAAAARAAGPASATPRAPTPPSGVPATAGPSSASASPDASPSASPGAPVSSSPAPPRRAPSTSRPPAPTDQRRSTPVAATPAGTAAASRQAERLSAERSRRPDTKTTSSRTRRSPARATMLILGGVVVVVVALVLVLSSGGGGKSSGQTAAGGQGATKTTSATHKRKQTSAHHGESTAPAVSPAETSVTVLNGTNVTGLARSLSDDLQQGGYLRATALEGTPPGAHTTTTVEYASGHRAEAQSVAKALEVTHVQPMETGVSSLAGAATVVVIAGEDKAAAVQ